MLYIIWGQTVWHYDEPELGVGMIITYMLLIMDPTTIIYNNLDGIEVPFAEMGHHIHKRLAPKIAGNPLLNNFLHISGSNLLG